MSKFCEEARHLIIQLFGHFVENKSQFLTANHAANLAFIVKRHFLSKSTFLRKQNRYYQGLKKQILNSMLAIFFRPGVVQKIQPCFAYAVTKIQCICVYTRSA